jgi:hypothetical protein
MPLDEYMCHNYVIEQIKKAEAVKKAKEDAQFKKQNEYKKDVLSKVFGDSYKPEVVKQDDSPEKGITLKKRPDINQPKDKWKIGNELKTLQAKFPHDRVLERMVQSEFSTNQQFLYPEEYDIFNQAHEKSLKKNFKNGVDEVS